MIVYESQQRFYDADSARARSWELDFGVMWHDGARQPPQRWPLWRLTWVDATGELIVVRLGPGDDLVRVLGTIPDEQQVEAALAGWEYQSSLAWVEARVAGFREEVIT